jgi:hypothetical protein
MVSIDAGTVYQRAAKRQPNVNANVSTRSTTGRDGTPPTSSRERGATADEAARDATIHIEGTRERAQV